MKAGAYARLKQIIGILRENEAGAKAGELVRKHGVSEDTIYAWKAKFGGMSVSDASAHGPWKMRTASCSRLLADAMLDTAALKRSALKEVVGPAAMRQAAAGLKVAFEVSERRACAIVQADRKSVGYRSCRQPDTDLRERLRALAVERRRFVYRRLFVLLRREGELSGKNYREEGLKVRKRRSAPGAVAVERQRL